MKQTKIELVEDNWTEFLEDENIYSENSRASLLEDDELSLVEEGFMVGYDEAE
jgi:hypothetical protein